MDFKKIDGTLATITALIGAFALLPKIQEIFETIKNNKVLGDDNHPAPI